MQNQIEQRLADARQYLRTTKGPATTGPETKLLSSCLIACASANGHVLTEPISAMGDDSPAASVIIVVAVRMLTDINSARADPHVDRISRCYCP